MTTTPDPPEQNGSIILVDDEVELVEALSAMLRAEYGERRVKATCDPTEALRWLLLEKPSVLITDVRMPGLSGLDLLARVHETWGPTPTIVTTAFPVETMLTNDHKDSFLYLPKPFSFRSLLDTMRQLEDNPRASFRGSISVSALADLLQLYAISGSTGVMRVRSGEQRGEVWLEQGQVVHARSGNLRGIDAFCAILRWPRGSILWQTRRAEVHSIDVSLAELMAEAYQIHHEMVLSGATRSSVPPEPGGPDDTVSLLLTLLSQVDGFVGALLVDSDSGSTLGSVGGGLDLTLAAAGNAELVRAKRATIERLGLQDDIEDIVITLGKQYHLIRPMRSRPGAFFYMVLDRENASLVTARLALARAESAASS